MAVDLGIVSSLAVAYDVDWRPLADGRCGHARGPARPSMSDSVRCRSHDKFRSETMIDNGAEDVPAPFAR